MATDFTYNNKTITSSGGFKPSGKDMPIDARTRVNNYADRETIPNPYVGMIFTVLEDETNSNKMTDYKVLSLKANSLGIADMVVDQVQRYVDYLGAGSGATVEQANQIQANADAIGNESSGLTKEVNDIKSIIGDSNSGLTKDVADLKANLSTVGTILDNINGEVI